MAALIRPVTTVIWDKKDISDAAFNINIQWGNTDSFPSLSLTVDQFRIDEELRKSSRKEIEITIEYPTRSSKLTGKFLHSETTENFGSTQSLDLKAISKAATLTLSPRRQRGFVGDQLISDIANDKAREYGYSIEKIFLEDDLSLREFLQMGETDAEFVTHLSFTNGSKVYWTIDGDVIGKFAPANSAPLKHQKKVEQGNPSFIILGPTLLESASRTIRIETQGVNKDLSGKTQDGEKEKDKDIAPKKADSTGTQIAQKPGDLKKKQQKDSNTSPYSKTKTDKEKVSERKTEAKKEEEVQLSTSFLAVPRAIGLKPGDALYFKDDGLDYKIDQVAYKQEGQFYKMDITAQRFISDKPLFPKTSGDIKKVLEELGDNEAKWAHYYWEPD